MRSTSLLLVSALVLLCLASLTTVSALHVTRLRGHPAPGLQATVTVAEAMPSHPALGGAQQTTQVKRFGTLSPDFARLIQSRMTSRGDLGMVDIIIIVVCVVFVLILCGGCGYHRYSHRTVVV